MPEDEKRPLPLRIAYLVYQQVAALIAAFALIAFISHFMDFDWRGFIATLVGQWNEYVRPAATWLFHVLVTVPFGWLGWQVEVPELICDYLAVGLILTLSTFREVRRSGMVRGYWTPWRLPSWQSESWSTQIALLTFLTPPFTVVLWPVPAALMLYGSTIRPIVLAMQREWDEEGRALWIMASLVIAPLTYFGILAAVNYLIL